MRPLIIYVIYKTTLRHDYSFSAQSHRFAFFFSLSLFFFLFNKELRLDSREWKFIRAIRGERSTKRNLIVHSRRWDRLNSQRMLPGNGSFSPIIGNLLSRGRNRKIASQYFAMSTIRNGKRYIRFNFFFFSKREVLEFDYVLHHSIDGASDRFRMTGIFLRRQIKNEK